jgi:hypothetical protein
MEVEQTRSGGSFAGSCRVQGKQIRADRGPRLKKGVLGLACLGRKEEAASLRAAHRGTGCKPSMGFVSLPHFTPHHGRDCRRLRWRLVRGRTASFDGDHETDTAPYRCSQPMAREWYASMLLDRNATGDRAKARSLLMESQAMYETVAMPFHAGRLSGRLAFVESRFKMPVWKRRSGRMAAKPKIGNGMALPEYAPPAWPYCKERCPQVPFTEITPEKLAIGFRVY